jgi:hypothetical protein
MDEAAENLGVNTALRAAITALMGTKLQERMHGNHWAQCKASAGQNDCAKARDYEILNPVDLEDWIVIQANTSKQANLKARRSIILDANDQSMQLSMAFQSSDDNLLSISPNGKMDFALCLLTMEEDEAAEGFPLILNQEDDEKLLTHNRFHSPINVTAVIANDNVYSHVVPVTRKFMGREGVVNFQIDARSVQLQNAQALHFQHEVTGAELEICIPRHFFGETGTNVAAEEEDEDKNAIVDSEASKGQINPFLENMQNECSELDEYESDGFVVHSDEEDNLHNDEDVCCYCRDGGELIVCDGGDHQAGCGCYFHLECINRDVVPPGDWVCEGCANQVGLDVGIEGHEFAFEKISTQNKCPQSSPPKKGSWLANLTSPNDEIFSTNYSGKERGQVDLDDSDESPLKIVPGRNKSKRRRIIYSDDEE